MHTRASCKREPHCPHRTTAVKPPASEQPNKLPLLPSLFPKLAFASDNNGWSLLWGGGMWKAKASVIMLWMEGWTEVWEWKSSGVQDIWVGDESSSFPFLSWVLFSAALLPSSSLTKILESEILYEGLTHQAHVFHHVHHNFQTILCRMHIGNVDIMQKWYGYTKRGDVRESVSDVTKKIVIFQGTCDLTKTYWFITIQKQPLSTTTSKELLM